MAKKNMRGAELAAAIEAINRRNVGGWRGYGRDAVAVVGTGTVGAITLEEIRLRRGLD